MNDVSLVFVTTDEGHVLIPALESVERSNIKRPSQIIVVDNASSDGIGDQIARRWPEIEVLRRDQRYGLPANLNHGIEASKGAYVVLCNSDLVFAPDAIESLARFMDEHPRVGMAAPKLLSPEGELRPSARRWYTPWVLLALKGPWARWTGRLQSVQRSLYTGWDASSAIAVDWVPCPATMVRRRALDEVGLMDTRFRLYFDDVDISLRMHEAGWEVWCVPEAEVIHLEQRASVRPFSRAWRWHLASLMKFWWKHKGLRPKTTSRPSTTAARRDGSS